MIALIGPGIGIVALAFAVFTFWKNWKPKRLQYTIVADQAIITSSKYFDGPELRVVYDGHDVVAPRIVVVRVVNTGKVEFKAEDFDRPISVTVGQSARIVRATVVMGQAGTDVRQELKLDRPSANEVTAPVGLMNPDDSIEFRLLVDGTAGAVALGGRVAGAVLSPVTARRRPQFRVEHWWTVVAVATAGLAAGIVPLFITTDSGKVPDLKGMTVSQAVAAINRAGFRLNSIQHVKDQAAVGTVISESPGAGAKVAQDAAMTVVVSDGP